MITVDEALAIVVTALNYQRLNKVQERVFREAWEGQSYGEIAKSTGYEPDYIKSSGAQLWKRLSTAFGEKVTKNNIQSVVKPSLRQTQVNVQQNLTIEVNLSGANLRGANLTGTTLVANLMANSQADSQKVIMLDDKIDEGEEANNQGIQYINKIASALERAPRTLRERASVVFSPNCRMRLTTLEGRQNQEFDFLICYQGKWGILQVDSERWHQDAAGELQRDNCLRASGISIISHYSATRCSEEADKVVQEFLEILSQV